MELSRRAFFTSVAPIVAVPVLSGFVAEDYALGEPAPPSSLYYGRTKLMGRIIFSWDELKTGRVDPVIDRLIDDVAYKFAEAAHLDEYAGVEPNLPHTLRLAETRFLRESPSSGRKRYMQPLTSKWVDEDGATFIRCTHVDEFEAYWRMVIRLQPEPSRFNPTKQALRPIIWADASPFLEAIHRYKR